MNPFQHGEVFVTEDGAETDLDIGHYERFLDRNLGAAANVTTGQVYMRVIQAERRGEYLGECVQVIPHITNAIKDAMLAVAHPDDDVVIHEIGGTVGDIESQPFLEAARQMRHDIGRDNVFFLHVSLVPYIGPSAELKTKPTQHSVAALRAAGIQPDAIVCRAEVAIPEPIKAKIAMFCDVPTEAVVSCPDAASIYQIPRVLHAEGLDAYLVRHLSLRFRDVDWTAWGDLLDRIEHPEHHLTIAVVGKYIDLPDAYLSVVEATMVATPAAPGCSGCLACLRNEAPPRWEPWTAWWCPAASEFAVEARSGRSVTPASSGCRSGVVPGDAVHGGSGPEQPGIAGAASREFNPDTPAPVVATSSSR